MLQEFPEGVQMGSTLLRPAMVQVSGLFRAYSSFVCVTSIAIVFHPDWSVKHAVWMFKPADCELCMCSLCQACALYWA